MACVLGTDLGWVALVSGVIIQRTRGRWFIAKVAHSLATEGSPQFSPSLGKKPHILPGAAPQAAQMSCYIWERAGGKH